jgi:hypothetical protein
MENLPGFIFKEISKDPDFLALNNKYHWL